VIGCGGRATFLLEILSRLGAGAEAYADPVEDAARSALRRFGGRYACANPARLLQDDGIDAVLIASRHDSHAPLARAAAAAGKHLLLEKPLALTLQDCAAIVEAVDRAAVVCLLGHKLRYAPLFCRLRAAVPVPLLSVVQVLDNRWPDGSWTADPLQGGGNVFSQGCHGADLALALHPAAAVSVAAAGGALTHPGAPHPDVLASAVTFADGSVCSLLAGDPGEPAHSKFFAQAGDGHRMAVLHDRFRTLQLGGETLRADPLLADPEGDTQLLQDFLACATAGRPSEVGAGVRDGWRAMRLLHAAWDSARDGRARPLGD